MPLRTYPRLTTDRLVLRLATPREAHAVTTYFCDNRLFHQPWSPLRLPGFYTDAYWRRRLAELRDEFLVKETALTFHLFPQEHPRRIIGRIHYSQIVRGVAEFCYVGYDMDEMHQGAGYMTEALRAGNDFIFHTVGLHRIMANYMPHNSRSGAVLKRLGFSFEGYARDYLYINGRWEDHVLTSLTNHDWRP